MINTFALNLLDWHDGQSSGLYAVGSNLLVYSWPNFDDMIRAIRELRAQHTTECTKLSNTLQLMLECNKQYCAQYQKWKENYSL